MIKKISLAIAALAVASVTFATTVVPPINQITIGYYSNKITGSAHPIKKSTSVVDDGAIVMYEHEIYHYGQHFSLNLGGSFSFYHRSGNTIYNVAVYPALRFWAHRNMWFSPYILLSVGPSALSQSQFDDRDQFGSHFTFQDILGVCARMGDKKALDTCVKFQHYSNANLFAPNHGFDVPILFSLGYDW